MKDKPPKSPSKARFGYIRSSTTREHEKLNGGPFAAVSEALGTVIRWRDGQFVSELRRSRKDNSGCIVGIFTRPDGWFIDHVAPGNMPMRDEVLLLPNSTKHIADSELSRRVELADALNTLLLGLSGVVANLMAKPAGSAFTSLSRLTVDDTVILHHVGAPDKILQITGVCLNYGERRIVCCARAFNGVTGQEIDEDKGWPAGSVRVDIPYITPCN